MQVKGLGLDSFGFSVPLHGLSALGWDLKSERVYQEFSCTNRPGNVATWVGSDYAHVYYGTFQAIWPKLRHLCGSCVSPIGQVQVLEGALNRHSGLYLA